MSVSRYLAALPADRRTAMTSVLKTIRRHLPQGYEEAFHGGMITWQVPLEVYPDTYNRRPLLYAALANQKNYMAVHLMCVYGAAAPRDALVEGFKAAGKKLDMGKACVRFRTLDDLPLPVIAKAVAAVPVKKFVALAKAVRR